MIRGIQPHYFKIYIGFREGYTDKVHSIEEVYALCQRYCDVMGLCVTVTPTRYIYTKGMEDGAIVGLINYPRFRSHYNDLFKIAVQIGEILMTEFKQFRVSIESSKEMIMLENKELSQ